jgi:hypothetical protein
VSLQIFGQNKEYKPLLLDSLMPITATQARAITIYGLPHLLPRFKKLLNDKRRLFCHGESPFPKRQLFFLIDGFSFAENSPFLILQPKHQTKTGSSRPVK